MKTKTSKKKTEYPKNIGHISIPETVYTERKRSTELTIVITSFGNAKQHLKTVEAALAELNLRGLNVQVLNEVPLS